MYEKIEFDGEYELQKFTNNHLKELFDLKFIATECQFNSLRFDALAFDEKTKSFVILEYKNKPDSNVINQGKSYYELFKDNHDNYIDRFNEEFETDFEKEYFHPEKTKVLIIGPEFTPEQIEQAKSPEYPFELYTVSLYGCDEKKGCVLYEGVNSDYHERLLVNLDDLKLNEETLLKGKSEEIIELYKNFKEHLVEEFNDLDLKVIVDAVSIKAQNNYICIINVKKSIKIHFYTKELEDEENKTRDISDITTGGPLSYYELKLNPENIDYAIDLIKQVHAQKVKK